MLPEPSRGQDRGRPFVPSAAAAPTDSAPSPAPSRRQQPPHQPPPRVRTRPATAHRRPPLSVIIQPPVSPPVPAGRRLSPTDPPPRRARAGEGPRRPLGPRSNSQARRSHYKPGMCSGTRLLLTTSQAGAGHGGNPEVGGAGVEDHGEVLRGGADGDGPVVFHLRGQGWS